MAEYADRGNAEQMRRHEIKPGITELAQVSGRNALSWEERFRLDLQVCQQLESLVDTSILAQTVWVVLRRQGVEGRAGDDGGIRGQLV